MRITKSQKQVLDWLKEYNAILILHRRPSGVMCYRMIDRDHKPMRNFQIRTIEKLYKLKRLTRSQSGQYYQLDHATDILSKVFSSPSK